MADESPPRASPALGPMSPLLAEIHRGRTPHVRKLLDTTDLSEINQPDAMHWSPLHHSSFLGQAKITELLLERGAKVNATEACNNFTPLHLATMYQKPKVVQLLTAHGADVDAKDVHGQSPIDIAEAQKLDKILAILRPAEPTGVKRSPSDPLVRSGLRRRIPSIRASEPSPHRRSSSAPAGDESASSNSGDEDTKLTAAPVARQLFSAPPSPALGSQAIVAAPTGGLSSPLGAAVQANSNGVVNDPNVPTANMSNWKKLYVKGTQVLRYQIIQLIVRILLVYLLELFVFELKRVLTVLLNTYTPLEMVFKLGSMIMSFVLRPTFYILKPIWPLLSPILRPFWDGLIMVVTPIWDMINPLLTELGEYLLPVFTQFWQFVIWIVDRLQYFFAPLIRLIWEPVVHFGVIFYQFVQPFLNTIYYVVFYVVGTITPLFTSLFKLIGYMLSPIWTVLQRVFLAPVQAFFSKIGRTLFNVLVNNYQKLLNLTWQAIQPMLNIRGFFSRLFGPIITGLKAILHWFLPDFILIPIGRLSVAIFGKDHIQGTETNSDETALMVIFMFVLLTYGSVIVWGYFFKTIIAIMYIFDETLSNKFYDTLNLLESAADAVNGTAPVEGNDVQMTFSWFLPDKWHHQIGILFLTATVGFFLALRLLREIAYGSLWLSRWFGRKVYACYDRCIRTPRMKKQAAAEAKEKDKQQPAAADGSLNGSAAEDPPAPATLAEGGAEPDPAPPYPTRTWAQIASSPPSSPVTPMNNNGVLYSSQVGNMAPKR